MTIFHILLLTAAIIVCLVVAFVWGFRYSEYHYSDLFANVINPVKGDSSDLPDALENLGFIKFDRGTMDVLYIRKLPYSWYEYEAIQYEHYAKRIKLDIKINGGYASPELLDAIYEIRNNLWTK